MTRNQSLAFRLVLFFFGLGIIALAYILFQGGEKPEGKTLFMWLSIGILYLVVSSPFLLSTINVRNFSGKIPSFALIWFDIFAYLGISLIILAVLMLTDFLPLKIAILIQAVALFLFVADLFWAFFAASHARGVAADEAEKLQLLTEAKAASQLLLLSVRALPAAYEKSAALLQKTIEELKYISPVEGARGLESNLVISIQKLKELCGGVPEGAHVNPAQVESEALHLQALVKERKLLRN
ncbi:MAG: hypothetical protein LBR16_08445 [Treponema sp.]|jgi:hypothetical protein|nr:hypothetical protein [Treponema sp.]